MVSCITAQLACYNMSLSCVWNFLLLWINLVNICINDLNYIGLLARALFNIFKELSILSFCSTLLIILNSLVSLMPIGHPILMIISLQEAIASILEILQSHGLRKNKILWLGLSPSLNTMHWPTVQLRLHGFNSLYTSCRFPLKPLLFSGVTTWALASLLPIPFFISELNL